MKINFRLPSGGLYPIRAKIVGKPSDRYGDYTPRDSAESFYHALMDLVEKLPWEVAEEFGKILSKNPPREYLSKKRTADEFMKAFNQGGLEEKTE